MPGMIRSVRVAIYGVLSMMILSTTCPADPGPLPMQNRFPLHYQFLTPKPASPQPLEKGTWQADTGLSYSSINFDHGNGQWDFLMDMEMTTLDLSLAYGLTQRLSLSLDIPLVSMQDGFMDGFLKNYHDTLGVGNYDRAKRPPNTFGYTIVKQGRTWINGRTTGPALADSVVSLDVAWPEPSSGNSLGGNHAFRGKMMGKIKIPVGDRKLGLGSGKWDVGAYWATEWDVRNWFFYLMPGLALISDPETGGADVSARNIISLFMGVAYRYNERWQWIAQINGYSSPVEETGINALDYGSFELGLGFRYQPKEQYGLVFSLGEDLALAGPDFTLYFGFENRFGLNSHQKSKE